MSLTLAINRWSTPHADIEFINATFDPILDHSFHLGTLTSTVKWGKKLRPAEWKPYGKATLGVSGACTAASGHNSNKCSNRDR